MSRGHHVHFGTDDATWKDSEGNVKSLYQTTNQGGYQDHTKHVQPHFGIKNNQEDSIYKAMKYN